MRADVGAPTPKPIETTSIKRATNKLFFPAKGATDLGFKISALAKLYALEAKVEAASWGATTDSDAQLLRDDDIATAWTCKPTDEKRCVLGLHFSEDASINAVRVYAERVKTIRLHTREGYVDAELPEARTHTFAVLGQNVKTRSLAIEVLQLRGNSRKPIEIAELEVYGETGTARGPVSIDPSRAYVALERGAWQQRGNEYEARLGFIEQVDRNGDVRRLARGSALIGKAGDRLVLVERLTSTRCDEASGTFFLVDTQTRVIAPLGALTGAGSDTFRHNDGIGLALGFVDESTLLLGGVVIDDDGRYVRKKTPARVDRRKKNTLEAWNFQREPLPRGGIPVEAACTSVESADLARTWECPLSGGAKALLADDGACGTKWRLALLDASGQQIAEQSGSGRGSNLWVSQAAGDELLVEARSDGRPSLLFRVAADGMQPLKPGSVLAVRPPAGCRSTCNTSLPNPNAPTFE